jgi:hypothetical protein
MGFFFSKPIDDDDLPGRPRDNDDNGKFWMQPVYDQDLMPYQPYVPGGYGRNNGVGIASAATDNKNKYILIVLLILVVLGGGYYCYMSNF